MITSSRPSSVESPTDFRPTNPGPVISPRMLEGLQAALASGLDQAALNNSLAWLLIGIRNGREKDHEIDLAAVRRVYCGLLETLEYGLDPTTLGNRLAEIAATAAGDIDYCQRHGIR